MTIQPPNKKGKAGGAQEQSRGKQGSHFPIDDDLKVENESLYMPGKLDSVFTDLDKSFLDQPTPQKQGQPSSSPLSQNTNDTTSITSAPADSSTTTPSKDNPAGTQTYDREDGDLEKVQEHNQIQHNVLRADQKHFGNINHATPTMPLANLGPSHRSTNNILVSETSLAPDNIESDEMNIKIIQEMQKSLTDIITTKSKFFVATAILCAIVVGILSSLPAWLRPTPTAKLPQIRCDEAREDEFQPNIWVHGMLTYEKYEELVSPVSGQVMKVYATPGTRAKAGLLLIDIASTQTAMPTKPLKIDTPVKMPFHGEILEILAKENAKVVAGEKLATIVNNNRSVVAHVSSAYFGKLQPLQGKVEAKLNIGKNLETSGKLTDVLLEQNRCSMKISVPNDVQLDQNSIGCPCWVSLTLSDKNSAILIPKAALVARPELNNLFVVFVASKKELTTNLRMVPVLVGMSDETNVEVLKGLTSNQKVVIWSDIGMSNLIENMKVEEIK